MTRRRNGRRPPARGFSLIELLIVITIILIIAAIAIPKLISVKEVANEAAAVSDMHVIQVAETAYVGAYGGFSATLADLGGTPGNLPTATAAQLLNSDLGETSPQSDGYVFTYAPQGITPVQLFTINADPVLVGVTGVRHFFSDQSAVVRWNVGAPASVTDPVL
ncbi:MAG: prepilin-type N-terminal cleavage/methylation domain-containing protein [Terriglobales bacterium]